MKRIWIAWEKQNRTLNMSKIVGAELYIFNYDNKPFLRYFLCMFFSLLQMIKCHNAIVFVQNPSVFLAIEACILKKIFSFKVVVDRHSNFMLGQVNKKSPKYFLFHLLSNYSLKHADITIVTNNQIAKRVTAAGGNAIILPDPLPDLTKFSTVTNDLQKSTVFSILFPSSWANDEPISEVVEVCRLLQKEIVVYVTGKPKSKYEKLLKNIPPNFVCTGYLTDSEYFSLMARCHVVMPLTTFPELLVCGGYEGVSLDKPLLLGDTPTLREYFYKGTVFTKCEIDELYNSIIYARANYHILKGQVLELHKELLLEWPKILNKFNCAIANMFKR